MSDAPALTADGLEVAFRVRGRMRTVLHGVGFSIARGEAYGLVGESGCGKSTVALAAVGYLPRNGRIAGGRILVDGRDLRSLSGAELRRLRSNSVAMVYQDPGKALNPSLRVGRQMLEVYEHLRLDAGEARSRALRMLGRVRITDPEQVMQRYPHQLSGGMQQRICIAMALAIEPTLLILDEPTTGLDATVEAEVLDLVRDLRREFSTSILFISHSLGVILRVCDRVGVLYAGRLVEEGTTAEVFRNPRHPYTVGLLRCIPRRGRRKADGPLDTIPGLPPPPGTKVAGCVFAPRCGMAREICSVEDPPPEVAGPGHTSRCHFHADAADLPRQSVGWFAGTGAAQAAQPILRAENITKTFTLRGQEVAALCDVSLQLMPQQTLGLVGESGSGKTTFARILLGLIEPDAGGRIELDGCRIEPSLAQRSTETVKALQIVFQNPDSAINRSHRVRRIIGRAIRRLAGLTGRAATERLHELAAAVRLSERYLDARPRQLSGGLKQRVAIARAFAGAPRLVVCDEPTSALDVSVQAAILNLLAELQAEHGVSYLFISHDLGVVRYLADRIAVLYLGRLMEIGPAEEVFSGPHHPYTEALLSAVPTLDEPDRQRVELAGAMPSAVTLPRGCVFHTRCPRRIGPVCDESEPPLAEISDGHAVRCHLPAGELGRADSPPAARRAQPELSRANGDAA
jgi:peptide/nickel transport system ATP-binding protein